ncbi:hypothetical protein [Rathayibacter soli]|uniref:hypothetical protein n=1 Tax=Rathayibacter soli TaxID=3144168 RepID=UPI0027E5A6D1|nr:hypothetical protein [Glaciibacter superstes]
MSCESPRGEGSAAASVRGLCLRHAVKLAAHLAAPLPVIDRPLHPSTPGYQEAVDAILSADRCDECPALTDDIPRRLSPYQPRLGKNCLDDAKKAADMEYPHNLPRVEIGTPHSDQERAASAVALQAQGLINDAWEAVILSWQPCEYCPVAEPPKPPKKERTASPADAVLEVLARTGDELGRSALIEMVASLDKNNFSSTVQPLVDSGQVTERKVGTAKLYRLATP